MKVTQRGAVWLYSTVTPSHPGGLPAKTSGDSEENKAAVFGAGRFC